MDTFKYYWGLIAAWCFRPFVLIIFFIITLVSIFIQLKDHALFLLIEIQKNPPTKYEVLSLVLSALTLLCYVMTVIVIAHQTRTDHIRRKKQATIEHVEKIKSIYREGDHWIENLHGEKIDLTKLKKEDKKKIKDMLSAVEHLSAGVHTDIFDIDMIDRMSGAFFIKLHKRVFPLIEEVRSERKNQRIYEDFSYLIDRLEKRRGVGKYQKNSIAKTGAMHS